MAAPMRDAAAAPDGTGGHRAKVADCRTAAAAANFNEYPDDNEWDIGIGDLIIDLDADIEKTNGDEAATTGGGGVLQHQHQQQHSVAASSNHQALGAATSPMATPPTARQQPGKLAVEHSATVHDKGLKMKIKRTKPGTKTSEAKHEIVKSAEQQQNGDNKTNKHVVLAAKRMSGGHRKDKTRADKHGGSSDSGSVSSGGVASAGGGAGSGGASTVNGGVVPVVPVVPRPVFPASHGPGPPSPAAAPPTPGGVAVPAPGQQLAAMPVAPGSGGGPSAAPSPAQAQQAKLEPPRLLTAATPGPAGAASDDRSSSSSSSCRSCSPPPSKKHRTSSSESRETADVCVGTSVGTITEPDCLGPCEPGTSVTLEGIVWHETGGVLVVNVTWRGKTYVGTLLDCTRHDWAPPRFCDSPTSDLDARTPKGRGKRGRATTASTSASAPNGGATPASGAGASGGAVSGAGAGNSATSDLSNFTETRSSVHSKLRNGTTPKGRTGRSSTPSMAGPGSPTPAVRTDVGTTVASKAGGGRKEAREASPAPSSANRKGSPPPSPILLECPEPNCSKKYKHINGLKYHQSHAHGSAADDDDTKDGTSLSETEESNVDAPSPPSAASPAPPPPTAALISKSPVEKTDGTLDGAAASDANASTNPGSVVPTTVMLTPVVPVVASPMVVDPLAIPPDNAQSQQDDTLSQPTALATTAISSSPPPPTADSTKPPTTKPPPTSIPSGGVLSRFGSADDFPSNSTTAGFSTTGGKSVIASAQTQQQQQMPIKMPQFKVNVKPAAALMPDEKPAVPAPAQTPPQQPTPGKIKMANCSSPCSGNGNGYKKRKKSPAGSPHPPTGDPMSGDYGNREDLQSPAYSDISDDSAPLLESEVVDKCKTVSSGGSGVGEKKPGDGDDHHRASPHAAIAPFVGLFNAAPFYGQPPYLVPSVPADCKGNKDPTEKQDTKPGQEKEIKKEPPSNRDYASAGKLLHPSHPYYSYYSGYPPAAAFMDPTAVFPAVLIDENSKKEPSSGKEEKSSPGSQSGSGELKGPSATANQTLPPIQVPNPNKLKVSTDKHASASAANDNHQILKESIEMKNQMSQFMYQRPDDLRRYLCQRGKDEHPTKGQNLSGKSVQTTAPSPKQQQSQHHHHHHHHHHQSSQQQHKDRDRDRQESGSKMIMMDEGGKLKDKRDRDRDQEGQKPTMETQGPPPPPTAGQFAAYIHPASYMQAPPHYAALPFDPSHPMYRGMNPMLVPGPYGGAPSYLNMAAAAAAAAAAGRYHAPEDLSRPPGGPPPPSSQPTKALDLLQQHASQYYSSTSSSSTTSSHKIHELQERALKSPTPGGKATPTRESPSGGNGPPARPPSGPPRPPSSGGVSASVSASGNRDSALVASVGDGSQQRPPTADGNGKPPRGKTTPQPDSAALDSRSPPTQRHVHTHHHTHVGLTYPLLPGQYPAPYGAAVLASQQAAAVASVINPYQSK